MRLNVGRSHDPAPRSKEKEMLEIKLPAVTTDVGEQPQDWWREVAQIAANSPDARSVFIAAERAELLAAIPHRAIINDSGGFGPSGYGC